MKKLVGIIWVNDSKQTKMTFFCNKKLSALLRGITSKHQNDFCCLNWLHSFAREKNLNCIKKHTEIKIFLM